MSFKSKMSEVAEQAIYERAVDRALKKRDQPTTISEGELHLTQQERKFLDLLARIFVKQLMMKSGLPYKEEEEIDQIRQ